MFHKILIAFVVVMVGFLTPVLPVSAEGMVIMTNVKAVYNVFFILNSKNLFVPVAQRTEVTPAIDGMFFIHPELAPTPDGKERLFKNFTRDLITLDVSRNPGMATSLVGFLFVVSEGADTRLMQEQFVGGGQQALVDLTTGEQFDPAEILNRSDVRRFSGPEGGQIVTVGGIKDGKIIMLRNDLYDRKDQITHLNKVYASAFSNFNGQEMTVSELGKLAPRFAARTSPALNFNRPINTIAIYLGSFAEDDGWDGVSLVATGNPNKVGQGFQDRTATSKGLGRFISYKTMKTMVKSKDPNPIIYVRDIISDNQFEELKGWVDKKSRSAKGRVVIIGGDTVTADTTPDYFVDLNVLKMSFNFRQQLVLQGQKYYGDVKKDDGTIHFGSQLATKVLAANRDKGTEGIITAMKKAVDSKFTIPQYDDLPSVDRLQLKGAFVNNLLALDPDAAGKYKFILRPWVNQVLTSVVKDLNDFRFKVHGYGRTAVPDAAAFFGKRLLRPDEMVCNSIPDGEQGTTMKYPSQGPREYMPVTVISRETYLARASSAFGFDTPEYKAIKELVERMAGSMVMTSSDPILRKALAGFDWDTDELFLVTESWIVNLLRHPVAVKIDYPVVPDKHPVTVGADFMVRNFSRYQRLGNASVGAVTRMFNGLLLMRLKRDYGKFFDLCRKLGNNGKGTDIYQPVCNADGTENGLEYIEITEDKVKLVFDQLKNMALTVENATAALEDITVAMGRFYQEPTIDSVKKFNRVKIEKGWVLSQFSTDVELGILRKGNAVISSGNDFPLIAPEIAKYVQKKYKDLLGEIEATPELMSEDQVQNCLIAWEQKISDGQKVAAKVLAASLMQLKSIYGRIEDKVVAADLFKANMVYFTNQWRKTFSGFTPEERVEIFWGGIKARQIPENLLMTLGNGKVLSEDFLAYAAKYSDREGAAERVEEADLDYGFDSRLTILRSASNKNAVKEKYQVAAKYFGDHHEAIITVRGGKLAVNGKPTSVWIGESAKLQQNGKLIFSDELKAEHAAVNGTIAFVDYDESDSGWGGLLLVVRNK